MPSVRHGFRRIHAARPVVARQRCQLAVDTGHGPLLPGHMHDLVLQPVEEPIGPVLDTLPLRSLAHAEAMPTAGVNMGLVGDADLTKAVHQVEQHAGVRVVGGDQHEGGRSVIGEFRWNANRPGIDQHLEVWLGMLAVDRVRGVWITLTRLVAGDRHHFAAS